MIVLVRMLGKLRALRRRQDGAAALEFAMVVPAFIALTVGAMFTANAVFTVSSMHYASEAAARCASIQTTVCTSSAVIQNYATSHYAGPSVSPSFVYSATGCGHTVTGTVTYAMNVGSHTISVPVSTSACYP
ncbi:MAG TPA: TadE/TadG family type IV pilus assembly protein [Caulobacteraceae bacterium]|jgi:Flp pilus assembly protein TadG|nr:TadE/TadG family type IV pilus assembly protein [Caulobacteraceae bacterium]